MRKGVENGWDNEDDFCKIYKVYLIQKPEIQTPGWYLFHWQTSRVGLDDAEQTS